VFVDPPARAAYPTRDLARVDQRLGLLASRAAEPLTELLAGQPKPVGEPLDQQRGELVGQPSGEFVNQPIVDQVTPGKLPGLRPLLAAGAAIAVLENVGRLRSW
jgi:hypothetical protein